MVRRLLVLAGVMLWALPAPARPSVPPQASAAAPLVDWPGADYDPAIPRLAQGTGFELGADMASPDQAQRYFEALAAAAPGRMRVETYGTSWEGRPLFMGIISSETNMARLEATRAATRRLADPRGANAGELQRIVADMPAIVWISHSIHGNEPGTTDAALSTAYHLLASRGDERVRRMLDETVVVVIPLLNPDGRARFLMTSRAARGARPDPSPWSAERDEPWPGGRLNHYNFDLNRDWFLQTQRETRATVAQLLEWMPVLVVDVHEMGTDQTYFFPPEADPANPHLTTRQLENIALVGRNNARWFDRFGLRYFTREIFDAFFPGYGSSWPNFQGSHSMVYEQGSSRGLLARRSDGTELTFADTVQSQFIASLSAIETVADNRSRFMGDFLAYRQSAIAEGQRERVRSYVFASESVSPGAQRLAQVLASNGVEVTRSAGAFQGCGRSWPAGSYVVAAGQPTKRLIRTLMDESPMPPAFVERQRERVARGERAEIYDITAWSLPELFNVPVERCAAVPGAAGERVMRDAAPPGGLVGGADSLAFVVPWTDARASRFLAAALAEGLRVETAGRPFTVGGRRHPEGSLVLLRSRNGPDLADSLARLAAGHGVVATGISDTWVEDGIDLGSPDMGALRRPRVALLWDDPMARLSAGHARFVLEQQLGVAPTLVRARRVADVRLGDFDVVVVPAVERPLGPVLGREGRQALAAWVRGGGTLVTMGTGSRLLDDEDNGLVELRREGAPRAAEPARDGGGDSREAAGPRPARAPAQMLASMADAQTAEAPSDRAPTPIAGALVRAGVERDHWLTAGVPATVHTLASGEDIWAPVPRDRGQTLVRFQPADRLLAAGVLWDESRRQLALKPLVVHAPVGRGRVVAFTQDPMFRAWLDGLNMLVANAVFRGPAQVAAPAVGAEDSE